MKSDTLEYVRIRKISFLPTIYTLYISTLAHKIEISDVTDEHIELAIGPLHPNDDRSKRRIILSRSKSLKSPNFEYFVAGEEIFNKRRLFILLENNGIE